MKRIHIGMQVDDIEASVRFYNTLFAEEPTVLKQDYAKWMLDDPRVNFSISLRCDSPDRIHLGIQVESASELAEVADRLKGAEVKVRETPEVTCCYAKSDKAWTADPQGVPWETFLTHELASVYGEETLTATDIETLKPGSCCK